MRRRRHGSFLTIILVLAFVFPPGAVIMAAGYLGQWVWERWS